MTSTSETWMSLVDNRIYMSILYTINPVQRLVHVIGEGVLTPKDLLCFQARLRADPLFDPDFFYLADWRNINAMEFSPDVSQSLAQPSVFSPRSRHAIVANTSVTCGLARLYKLLMRRGASIQVFDTVKQARDWLHVPVSEHHAA